MGKCTDASSDMYGRSLNEASDVSDGRDSTAYVGDTMLDEDPAMSGVSVLSCSRSGNNDRVGEHGFEAMCKACPEHEDS